MSQVSFASDGWPSLCRVVSNLIFRIPSVTGQGFTDHLPVRDTPYMKRLAGSGNVGRSSIPSEIRFEVAREYQLSRAPNKNQPKRQGRCTRE